MSQFSFASKIFYERLRKDKQGPELAQAFRDLISVMRPNYIDAAGLSGHAYIKALEAVAAFGCLETELMLDATFKTMDSFTESQLDTLRLIALRNDPVLIYGPPGTGKELLARALHGCRNPNAFIAINAAELHGGTLRAELFGYKKGSYTGANTNHEGLVSAACEGTLFIDEVAELPLEGQSILLRLLSNGTYRPVGASGIEQTSYARIVVATNKDLKALVSAGKFKGDLYDRLNVFSLRTTSLHKRGIEEVKLIAWHYGLAINDPIWLEPLVQQYKWPGNVRELIAFITRYKVLGLTLALDTINVSYKNCSETTA